MRLFRITLCAALLACSTTAFARSDAELRDMAATFGLTPAQSDILFTRLVRQQERINALAARWSINSKTLRAASIALGATSSALSDQDFLKLVAVKAEQAKLASDRIASLSEELARLDPGGIRTKALALLAGGEAAFNAGRLDEAASAFAKIEALRLDQLAGGHDAWVEAVFANALVSDVKGDRASADRIYDKGTADADNQAAQSRSDAWGFQLAKARGWFTDAQRLGDRSALNQAESIVNTQVLPRVNRAKEPEEWAQTQWFLAAILTVRGSQDGDPQLLKRAIAAYDSIDQTMAAADDFDAWAGAQVARASSLMYLFQQGDRDAKAMNGSLATLRRIVAMDNNRLDVDTRVAVHGNIANILMLLGFNPPDVAVLRESDGEFATALAAIPAGDTAAMRGQLGVSRCNLMRRLGSLAPATTELDDAIRICAEVMNSIPVETAPYYYALARSNWGDTVIERAKRTNAIADVTTARDAFASARGLLSRSDNPRDWASVSLSLTRAELILGIQTSDPSLCDRARATLGEAGNVIATLSDATLVDLKNQIEALFRNKKSGC